MSSSAKLFIERPLSEEELLALSGEAERRIVADFGTEARRREALMWRHIIHRELGSNAKIAYNDNGAPILENRTEHISVSHSADFVAVIISDQRCAIDIERLDRNFERVATRYLNPDEEALSDDSRLRAVAWCAKEVLYKYAGERGLDLFSFQS